MKGIGRKKKKKSAWMCVCCVCVYGTDEEKADRFLWILN